MDVQQALWCSNFSCRFHTYVSRCVLFNNVGIFVSPSTHLYFIFFFIHYLQLGRNPVAGVVTCYINTDYEG